MSNVAKNRALILGTWLTLVPAAIAHDGAGWMAHRGDGERFGGRWFALLESDRFRSELGLTDQQAEKLRQILVDSRKTGIRTRADLQVRHMELRELLRADQPNREAVMKKVQEISDLRAQMMRQHVDSLLDAKTVLTPEQQKKVRAMIAERGFGRGERRFRRPGFPGGRGDWRGPDRPPLPFGPETPED